MTKKEANIFINSIVWRFAKTMPEIPHEYIVTGDHPEKSETIENFINEIEKNGYTKSFFQKKYKYLDIGEYKYWVIDNIINRQKIEVQVKQMETA